MKYDHELKTWIEYFEASWDGRKKFEIRSTEDRTFEAGQHILLKEWDPTTKEYTPRWLHVKITYQTNAASLGGFPEKLCVFGFVIVRRGE